MARDFWRTNRSGDWTTASDWLSGVPASGDDAVIQGKSFTVTLSTEQAVANLSVSGQGVVLDETASGSLDLADGGLLTIANGAIFDVGSANGNFAGTTQVQNATVSFTNGAALGAGDIAFDHSVLAVSDGSVSLASVTFNDETASVLPVNRVEVATGAELSLGTVTANGSLMIGDATHQGSVQIGTLTANYLPTLEVAGGTLELIDGNMYDLSNARVAIDAGATLDLHGGQLTVGDLNDLGTIVNSSRDVARLIVTPTQTTTSHGGMISGDIVITVPATASGVSTLSTSALDGTFSLSNGGGISVGAAALTLTGSLTIGKTGQILLAADNNSGIPAYVDIRSTFSIAGQTLIFGAGALILEGAGTISGTIGGLPNMTGSGYVDVESAGTVTLSNTLNNVSLFMDGSGTLVLSHANNLNFFAQTAGTTRITNIGALGSGDVELDGGVLVSTVSGKLSNDIDLSGMGAIATAKGTVLDLAGAISNSSGGHSLTIGNSANTGTVVFDLTAGGARNGGDSVGGQTLTVAAGTLRLGNADGIQGGLSLFSTIDLAAKTKLDLHGQSARLDGLVGSGTVTSSGKTAATLQLVGASFDGAITGKTLALEIIGDLSGVASPLTTLSHAESYGGGTFIDFDAILALVGGGTVKGAITDGGILQIDKDQAFTLANTITGMGELDQIGGGVTSVTAANSYSGGTLVEAGTLSLVAGASLGSGDVTLAGGVLQNASTDPLGSGTIHLSGGELLYTVNDTLGGTLDFTEGSTSFVATAHGTTLTIASDITVSDARIILGDGSNDGTIVLDPASFTVNGGFGLEIVSGTVQLGNATIATALQNIGFFGLEGGTLDLDGQSVTTGNFHQYAGTLTDTGAAVRFTLADGQNESYSTISGAIAIVAETDAVFDGTGSFTSLTVSGAHNVTIGGAASEQVILDDQGATLTLTAASALTGHIAGFGSGDMLDLQGVGYSSATKLTYNAGTHMLKVTDGTNTVSVTLDGNYTKGSFSLSDDGSGHAEVGFANRNAPAHASTFASLGASVFAAGHEVANTDAPGLEHNLHLMLVEAHSVF